MKHAAALQAILLADPSRRHALDLVHSRAAGLLDRSRFHQKCSVGQSAWQGRVRPGRRRRCPLVRPRTNRRIGGPKAGGDPAGDGSVDRRSVKNRPECIGTTTIPHTPRSPMRCAIGRRRRQPWRPGGQARPGTRSPRRSGLKICSRWFSGRPPASRARNILSSGTASGRSDGWRPGRCF